MKVGDLVQWYTEYADSREVDVGIITELDSVLRGGGMFIYWLSGDGNGWFDMSHPSIGVISESR